MKADLWAALQEFEDLPLGEGRSIHEAAVTGISRGRDLATIASSMTKLGVSRERAGEIALYLANRSTSMMDVDRLASLGIIKARWVWSGVCGLAGHKDADGKTYDVGAGLKISGVTTYPGREFGCSCVGNGLVPGLD